MIKRIWVSVLTGAVLVLGAAATVAADHMKGCHEHTAQAAKARDAASSALADAKKATTLAEMRRGIDRAEKSLAESKEHMSACMEMMEKMHGGMMEHDKGMMGGMMSDKGSSPATAAKTIDPVCRMEVDTKTALSSTYKGKTYYFCSAEDKAAFDKNPDKYLPWTN